MISPIGAASLRGAWRVWSDLQQLLRICISGEFNAAAAPPPLLARLATIVGAPIGRLLPTFYLGRTVNSDGESLRILRRHSASDELPETAMIVAPWHDSQRIDIQLSQESLADECLGQLVRNVK